MGTIFPMPTVPNTEETAERQRHIRTSGKSVPAVIDSKTESAVETTPVITAAVVTCPPAIMSAVITGSNTDMNAESEEMKVSAKENAVSVTVKTAPATQSILIREITLFSAAEEKLSFSAPRHAAASKSPSIFAKFAVAFGTAAAMSFSSVTVVLNALRMRKFK